ncbi:MAG TPA: TetR/AcrR family transcriptional regulator [Solirubrobacterales bacterium]|nr:TetR/AcrR family transcriptional regulator [Solirubrobacterales bacterium]
MRRRLNPDERRKEILQAAARVFSGRPYDEVHVDEIAREAGASRALINHYFGDKRGLFLAVARAIVERFPTTVRTDLTDLGPEAMVEANTAAWLDAVEASRETFLAFARSGPIGGDPELEALQDELRDRLAARVLANHLGSTEIPQPALFAMRATLGMIERAVIDWLAGKATRPQTHALIATAILATVRDVLPAVGAAS